MAKKVEEQSKTLAVHKHYVQSALDLKRGSRVVICNGRVIGPFDDDETFTSEDFALLERFSQKSYGDKLFKNLIKADLLDDDDDYGETISVRIVTFYCVRHLIDFIFTEKTVITDDMIMKIVALLVPRPQTRSRFDVPFHGDEHSAIKIPAHDPDSVAFELTAIVDPVSRGAQKLGPILLALQQTLNCHIKVFLNCLDKNSDMPLKRYVSFNNSQTQIDS